MIKFLLIRDEIEFGGVMRDFVPRLLATMGKCREYAGRNLPINLRLIEIHLLRYSYSCVYLFIYTNMSVRLYPTENDKGVAVEG